ncbi:GNAT family N-acetyltransferase [Nocardia rhamnosiphila]|uniref:GNAT family N-acetyltransferase n=1 Tax=Nocardia rhamnosiphila TaxID=426716 RepID=UPI002246E54F|nr:GNAT family N-acetyltransferase [Nocardia zapadnayensis]
MPARGAGIGDQLMTHTVDWAREHGYREIRLWVRENNEHATNLYLRHAFQFTGESKPHFADPSLRTVEMRHDLF